jgi:hypothetical protein
MAHEIAAAKKSSMPAWMVLAGVLAAIAGWMTRNYALAMMDKAIYLAPVIEADRRLPPIPGVKPVTGPTVEAAASLGYLGLGLLIFAAALLLAGLVVVAVRR